MKKEKILKNNYILKIIVLVIIFGLGVTKVNAATNPYKEKGIYGTNCTWYAWQQAYKRAGVALPGFGNAKDWLNDAKKAGYQTGSTPRAKSIIVWDDWTDYGHVGYVEKYENGKVYVWHSSSRCQTPVTKEQEEAYEKCYNDIYYSVENSNQETDGLAITSCQYLITNPEIACEYAVEGTSVDYSHVAGYIYLDIAPTKTNNNHNTNSTNNNDTNQSTKSNNANLSSLKIGDIDFTFKTDILKYELVVDNEVASVNVEAKVENNKAKVVGIGEKKLEVGLNIIEVVVTAEDNTKKTYIIEIKRKDNNANLSSLSISGIEFPFDKNTLEYNLDVNSDIFNVKVDATLESEAAKVEGLGEYELNTGENIIKVKVIAEDETEKVYKITINKEEKENITEEKKSKKDNKLYLIIGGLIIAFVIIISLVILIVKKHKKIKM